MKYLIKTTQQYRCDSQKQAQELIEKSKADGSYAVTKYSSQQKFARAKGEIVDSWFRVTIVKTFTKEREPEKATEPYYGRANGKIIYPREKQTARELQEANYTTAQGQSINIYEYFKDLS